MRLGSRKRLPVIITFHRTFQRHGGNRKGAAITRELAKPAKIDFWASLDAEVIRSGLVRDAALILGCPQDDVVLSAVDGQFHAWKFNGRYADVVIYKRW